MGRYDGRVRIWTISFNIAWGTYLWHVIYKKAGLYLY